MTEIEGAFVPSLGLYLLVERFQSGVGRIYFSREEPDRPGRLAEEIAAYLRSGGACPQVNLDFSGCTDFQKKVYALVRSIPWGETMTYGQVAKEAGRPGAARAVGRALAANPFPILIPCHRVVARDGLGGYFWGRDIKEKLLRLEREGQDSRS